MYWVRKHHKVCSHSFSCECHKFCDSLAIVFFIHCSLFLKSNAFYRVKQERLIFFDNEDEKIDLAFWDECPETEDIWILHSCWGPNTYCTVDSLSFRTWWRKNEWSKPSTTFSYVLDVAAVLGFKIKLCWSEIRFWMQNNFFLLPKERGSHWFI